MYIEREKEKVLPIASDILQMQSVESNCHRHYPKDSTILQTDDVSTPHALRKSLC